jgi:hypothetical protein
MNILSASTQRSNESRMTESEMAQLLANTNLGAARSSYEAQAATQKQKALAELLNQIAQSQFSVEQGVGQNADALATAIMNAGGTPRSGGMGGSGAGSGDGGGSTQGIVDPAALQQLAQLVSTTSSVEDQADFWKNFTGNIGF